MNLLIESHYLPCIHYFVAILQHENIMLEACENFQKQTYRNRCKILTSNKIETLTVPLIKSNSKTLIREIEIDQSQNWQNIHWRTIRSAYGKAPYFEYFGDYFHRIYDKKTRFLWDLNLETLTICLKLLSIEKNILLSKEYNKEGDIPVNDSKDMRSFIHPKTEEVVLDMKYVQVFGKEFVPNLSVVDLIFNEGPNAKALLRKAAGK
jgi:hypothetical protein